MARDYKNAVAKPKTKAKVRPPGSWVSFVSGVLVGLTCAYVLYLGYGAERISGSGDGQTADGYLGETTLDGDVTSMPARAPLLPKPTFDFYKILPEMEVKVPEWELAGPDAGADSQLKPGTYVLQVGSYKSFSDADRAKAQLALHGIQAKIHRVVINGQDVWYRVHVGPYEHQADIQAMRIKLLEAGNDFILLRVGELAG